MLTGIDPDYTEILTLGGAQFTLGLLPASIYQRIHYRNIDALESAQRRVLKVLHAEGIDPEGAALWSTDKTISVSNIQMRTLKDGDYRAALVWGQIEAVKYSLRAHTNFLKPDGTPIPFALETVQHEGIAVPVVGAETLRWYRVNHALASAIFLAVQRMSAMTASEKKA